MTQKTDFNTLIDFLNIPLGNSNDVFDRFKKIPNAIHRGSGFKQFVFVRGERNNKVLLVAHADTVIDTDEEQNLVQEDEIIRNLNGILGADDRAGCAIVWLLKDLGHSLLIVDGEEQGQIGSNWLMNENEDIADEINQEYQFVIEFDRRNGQDFKCYDVGTDEFRSYIQEKTGYTEPDRRAFTDIVTLCRDIAGVNLSVGYYNEHSDNEYLVLSEWENTLNICRKWLSEEYLPRFELNKDYTGENQHESTC